MRHASAVVLLFLGACSQPLAPHAPVTLLVENTTCDSTCVPIHILGLPHDQPRTPSGMWSIEIGVLATRFGCFTLPPSAAFRVISNGVTERTYSWTLGDPIALGTPITPVGRLQATPSTVEFVPAGAAGWTVALPRDAGLSRADACTPGV